MGFFEKEIFVEEWVKYFFFNSFLILLNILMVENFVDKLCVVCL